MPDNLSSTRSWLRSPPRTRPTVPELSGMLPSGPAETPAPIIAIRP